MDRIAAVYLNGREYVLPKRTGFYACPEENACHIDLCEKAAGLSEKPFNMQTEDAAFEAWALLLHHYSAYAEIRLGLQEGVALPVWPEARPFLPGSQERKTEDQKTYAHYNRFLYRVMKLQEEYSWFKIADAGLEGAVQRFRAAFYDHSLCNNVPTKPASPPGNWEGRVEAAFAEDPAASQRLKKQTAAQGVDVCTIHRQLPVGLFLEKKSKETQIFTASHSAIDLWGISGDKASLVIYELKTNNKMPGVITELMFYANYMRDMFVEHSHHCRPLPVLEKEQAQRSYDALIDACKTLRGVYAFMLADELDDCVTQEVLAEMNRNTAGITYDAIRYAWKKQGDTADIQSVKRYFDKKPLPDKG